VKRLRDPVAVIALVGVVLVVAGFAAMLLGWRGAAATLSVPLQLPYLVSGGIGGIALIGLGLSLCNLAASRREAAREIVRWRALVDQAVQLLEAQTSSGTGERVSAQASTQPSAMSASGSSNTVE
jgi:nitrate reductase gamma subunit